MDDVFQQVLNGEKVFENAGCPEPKHLSNLKDKKFAIYGIGECSHWFHEIAMKRMGMQPIVALDRDDSLGQWWDIPVTTSQDFALSTNSNIGDIDIIVCVGLRETYNQICKTLRKNGFFNLHFLHDFYEFHSFFVWDTNDVSVRMINNKEQFKKAFALLTDNLSKEIFSRLTQIHNTRHPVDIPSSPQHEQYFLNDLPLSQGHHTYVCCGAYDGENIKRLGKNIGRTDTIICFEPEPLIYSKLADCARNHLNVVANSIVCFQNAVSNENGVFPFISGDGLGSRLDPAGDDYAQCVKLDDALVSFNPTFISMDIEGAEVMALSGANAIINECKPDLGVCAYHYPEQIAEVILKISEISPHYKFFVRNYTSYLTETVVYASHPNKRT